MDHRHLKHLLLWLASTVASLNVVKGQGQEQQQPPLTQWGAMEDLSTFPTVSNITFAPRQGDRNVDETLHIRPTLSVKYDAFGNFTTPSTGSTQIYKVSVLNEGPGDVTQLAIKIEDFNTSSAFWGLNTLDSNDTYQYLPKYRAPLRQGDKWTFGFIQNTNRSSFAEVEPLYGQTGDGWFFNFTSVIPSPPNPDGTDAELVEEDVKESYWRDQRYVIWSGRVTNTGSYSLSAVGVDVENITTTTGTWHLVYDPATNATYLPLRSGFLHPKESQRFGFIMPVAEGWPNVSLSYVTTPNALYNITAPNVFNEEKPREFLPRMGSNTTLQETSGGLRVPYPPTRFRPGQHQEGEHPEGQHQEGEHPEGQHQEGEHPEGQHQEGEHPEGQHQDQYDDHQQQQQQQQQGEGQQEGPQEEEQQQQGQQRQPQEQRGDGQPQQQHHQQQQQQQRPEEEVQDDAERVGQGEPGMEGGQNMTASVNETQAAEKTLVKGGLPLKKKKIHHRLREIGPAGRQ